MCAGLDNARGCGGGEVGKGAGLVDIEAGAGSCGDVDAITDGFSTVDAGRRRTPCREMTIL
jgi:hypothetical protein